MNQRKQKKKNSEWKLLTHSKLQRKDFKLNYLKQLLKVKHSPYEQFAKLKVKCWSACSKINLKVLVVLCCSETLNSKAKINRRQMLVGRFAVYLGLF